MREGKGRPVETNGGPVGISESLHRGEVRGPYLGYRVGLGQVWERGTLSGSLTPPSPTPETKSSATDDWHSWFWFRGRPTRTLFYTWVL